MEISSRPLPLSYWAASWAFWLCVFAAVGAMCLHRLQTHESKATLSAKTSQIEYLICKRYALSPRPTWQECLARSQREERDLLAPSTLKDPSDPPASQKIIF